MGFLKKFKEHREEKRKKQENTREFRKRAFWKVVNFIQRDEIDPRKFEGIPDEYEFELEGKKVSITENFRWLNFSSHPIFLKGSYKGIMENEIKDSIMRFENKEQQEMMKSS